MATSPLPAIADRGEEALDTLQQAPIGVFDSGMGGLSIVRALSAALPAENIIYFADTANCPYGHRDEQFIRNRTLSISLELVERGAKLVVIACNTACAVALDTARFVLGVPVVGLEPAVKPAAKLTQTGRIGVFATTRTIASSRLANLIELHAGGIEVELVAASGWVEEVETGIADRKRTMSLVEALVRPVVERGADVLVLGCTHYPFLEPLIREIAGPGVNIVDSGAAIARRTEDLLARDGLLQHSVGTQRHLKMITSSPDISSVRALASRLLDMPVEVHFSPA